MKKFLIATAMAVVAIPAAPAIAQTSAEREYREVVREAQRDRNRDVRRADSARDVREANRDYRRDVREARRDYRQYRNYDYNRYEPGSNTYYADRYYRDGRYYQTRTLRRNDRIYRGGNGQYYCRRNDGTTGLIVGGAVGGLIGNSLDNGRSSILGTIIGAGAGALLGREVDRGRVRCR